MKVALRADASIEIGTGHVMRCLTLAGALTAKGARCEFICREHNGHLIEHIRAKGHAAHSLPMEGDADADLPHSAWLGATHSQDARACEPILAAIKPDWLVVDHYALDARWQGALAQHCGGTMALDDLADRPHACRILLDQTFGRQADDYRALVPADCTLLCGSGYALLRPEFAALRPYSLRRRAQPKLQHLLITLGGVDKDNVTTRVLAALQGSPLSATCEITVVMGSTAPWLDDVRRMAQAMRWRTTVRVGVHDMARLMADSDLAIGAAGATAWERCCLGLPSAMLVLADNQRHAAGLLEQAEAARIVRLDGDRPNPLVRLIDELGRSESRLRRMSEAARTITDGEGAKQVANLLVHGDRE
jgi:UDP-2,4-diacetamido-2,4,6-trideoxy-beta-L-altropyranose hydrolase